MRRLIALVALAAAVGCGTDNGTGTEPSDGVSVSGTYTLTTINGSALPFRTQDDANIKVDMVSSVYTISQGTFTQTSTYRITPTGSPTQTETDTESGTVTYSNGTAHFTLTSVTPNHSFDMAVSDGGHTLTLSESGYVFV